MRRSGPVDVPRLAAALVALSLLAGCVPASPDADTYDDKAAVTLGSAVSDVMTVERLLQMLYGERMLRPTAVAQLRASEDALATATTAFTELNPPPSRDPLNRQVSALLGDAGDLLAEARVAVERRDVTSYRPLAEELRTLADDLGAVEERVR